MFTSTAYNDATYSVAMYITQTRERNFAVVQIFDFFFKLWCNSWWIRTISVQSVRQSTHTATRTCSLFEI